MHDEVMWFTTCPFCGKTNVLSLPLEGFLEWRAGALVQDAFPDLSADEREQLISGMCPNCWEKMFGGGALFEA